MKHSAILAKALHSRTDCELRQLADLTGLTINVVTRAANGAKGQPTSANGHLRLCAWLGIDPVTGEPNGSAERSVNLDYATFALATKMTRLGKRQTLREAAADIGISFPVLGRIENGDLRSFDVMLAVCEWADLNPRHYLIDVSRGTSRNKNEKEFQSAAA